MQKSTIIFLLIILLFNTACNQDEGYLLEKAETFIDTNRDSLIHYLKLIDHPEKLPPPQRAKYGLIQANKLPTEKESELSLEYSLDYFTKERDTIKMIECYVAMGFYYQDSLSRRIKYLNVAKDLAMEINHNIWITRLYLDIGYSYERLEDNSNVLANLLKALDYVPQDNYLCGLTHWSLANTYKRMGMKDESVKSFLNVIENAKIYSPKSVSPTYKQLSDIYLESKDFEKALEYINLSIQYRTNIKEGPSYNLAKAIIFINTQELDSARRYLNYAIESPNQYISNRALGYLHNLNTRINQYDKAYYAKLNEDEGFYSMQSAEEGNIIRQKYTEEKLKNENNQLKIDKQQQENYSLVITIILLIVFALSYIIYSYKQKQQILIKHRHEEQLLKEKALLHESQNQLLKRDNELALLQQKAATLRASLFKKMSLSEKLPSLDKEGTKRTDNRKISLTEQDFVELRRTVDAAYNDFSKRLSDAYPNLSEDDINFCCLIKIQVDMQDLSDIYCISKAGITKRKMRIKKNQLQIEANISLDNFIRDF